MVEILGPDGLRDDPKTLGRLGTITVGGGTQALTRTEKVQVSIDGAEPVVLRRPTLLGAILIKARATSGSRKKRQEHRQDLIRLLTFVEDPRQLAADGELTTTEQRWLRRVESTLAFDDRALIGLFPAADIQRARQAFDLSLVTRSP